VQGKRGFPRVSKESKWVHGEIRVRTSSQTKAEALFRNRPPDTFTGKEGGVRQEKVGNLRKDGDQRGK